MGDFDDVLAMEPGDEWDDHVVGVGPTPQVDLADLAVMLQLPNASVDLRGDVPPDVVDVLSDLADDDLELLGDAVNVTLTVRSEGNGWALDDLEQGQLAQGDESGTLLPALLELLERLAIDTDPMRLHLDVACVQLADAGVLLTEARPGIASDEPSVPGTASPARSDERVTIVSDLLEDGADYVSIDLLSVLPGSRTVFGHPSPPFTSTHDPVRASTVSALAPVALIQQVVFLDHDPGHGLEVTELDASTAAIELLHSARDLSRFGPAALDALAYVIAGARCSVITYSDPDLVAAAISGLRPLDRTRLIVPHRFDEAEVRTAGRGDQSGIDGEPETDDQSSLANPVTVAVKRGRSSLRVVRFDDTGALFDGVSGLAAVLSAAELDALESCLVKASKGRSGSNRSAALSRLSDAGIELPLGVHAREVPGVESFGLPNCPAGGAAGEIWGGEPNGRIVKAAGSPPTEIVPGAIAQAIERGLVAASDAERDAILSRHESARREVAEIEQVLDLVLDLAGSNGIVPLVLGSAVLAHDGLLPPDFTDAEQIDLLVDSGDLESFVEVLVDAGFEQALPSVTDDPDRDVGHELIRPGATPVTVQLHARLAVGPFGALVNHDEFHRRSVPVRIQGRWCRALHPEDRFVLTCVQLDLDPKHSSVQDMRDVILSAPRAESLMAESLEASERWGATTSVIASLRRVHAAMPGLSPWLAERASRYEGRNRRKIEKQDKKRGLRRLRRR